MWRNLKFLHMSGDFKFLHMSDVEKSEISFNMCTIYGILLHLHCFVAKFVFFWRFTLFCRKIGLLRFTRFCVEKILAKIVPVDKKWQLSGMTKRQKDKKTNLKISNVPMTLTNDRIVAWVTRPERPKGAKDEVKQARRAQSRPEGPLPRSRAPEGPLDF